jgi:N-terminal domain of anti-restriction factor ArdC
MACEDYPCCGHGPGECGSTYSRGYSRGYRRGNGRRYRSPEERSRHQQEALARATTGTTLSNYPAIFEGFMAKGIPESEIQPRINVLTFDAWKALGRSVKKGEHGVKVLTWITAEGKEEQTGESGETDAQAKGYRFCKRTTVFHVSQTEVRQ